MKVRAIAAHVINVMIFLFLSALVLSGCGRLSYDKATEAYEKGQYDRALKLYRKISKEDPKGKHFNKANFMIGEIYKRQLKLDNALKHYQVIADNEGSTYLGHQAKIRIAQVRDAINLIEAAKSTYDNSPKTPENNDAAAEALFKLGETCENPLESCMEAIKWYRKLVEEFPDHSGDGSV